MANITTHLDATYSYTQAGLVGSLTYPVYPLNGNPTAPWPTTFTYSYDGMSRPVSVQDNRGPYQDPLAWAQGAQYDFAGRISTWQRYSPAWFQNIPTTYMNETESYNVNGQLSGINWSVPYGGGTLASSGEQYVYSATENNGQITQLVDSVSGETVTYQYDSLKRLTSASAAPVPVAL